MLHRSCIGAFGLLALLAALSLPSHVAAGKNPPRPFTGTAVGMVIGFEEPNELIIEYTGTATHLGAFSRTEHLFLNGDGSFEGTMVFTAANGDELWLDFEGAFTSPTTAEGTYTFTGGTGRFQGATGAATFEAETPDGINVEATFEGTIRY